jgi:hypothetical protein
MAGEIIPAPESKYISIYEWLSWVVVSFKSGTGILPVNHAQDARATIKLTH